MTSIDLTNPLHLWIAVMVLAQAGMFSHYLKKWLRKEIEGSLLDYLLRDHPRETALALFTLYGITATAILSGQFDALTLKQIVMPSWLLGYTVDSAMNKGAAKPA